jgi:hypothetical protein
MKSIKGPAIFLAQFVGDKPPFDSFDGICGWAASLGYKGVQIAVGRRLIDLESRQQTHYEELRGRRRNTASRSPDSHYLQGQSLRSTRLRRCLRRVRRTACPRQPGEAAGVGGRAGEARRAGKPQPRPRRACHFLRRAGLAVPLSVAAAAGGAGRCRLRRARETLEADPRPP